MTAAALGPRQAAVLAHLEEHPGLTAGELARAFGLRASLYKQLARLEGMACIVGVPAWNPGQGRQVIHWHVAPPGTMPPPAQPPDPVTVERIRERDRKSQRARRARARGLTAQPGVSRRSAAPDFPGAACRTADPDLFFPPEAERERDRQAREAKAKAVCAGCPARAACYAAAAANGERWGIWGGVDFGEREKAARAS